VYQPKFSFNSTINQNLAEIERFYGRLEGMRIPQQLFLNLERTNLVQSAFVSNSIEGNPLPQPVVTNLLLNDRVPVNRDEKEVVNYFQLLKSLAEKTVAPFSLKSILEIHDQLFAGVNESIRGQIRGHEIIIGSRLPNQQVLIKHNPPFHAKEKIAAALEELIKWVNESQVSLILKAGIFHHEFVYLHPFTDGNGRACRLVTALILLKYGYQINKYFVLDDYYDLDRPAYSDKLHTADFGDKTAWLEYFTSGMKYSLQSAIGKIEVGLEKLSFDLQPTPKEQRVLKIARQQPNLTSAYLVKNLNISRQQAFNLLQSLVKKGFLEKHGQTKNSYYLLRRGSF
jgi:Fic family protein